VPLVARRACRNLRNLQRMIQYVTGVLGAGKTFHAVRLAMDHLARGGTVVTNIECRFQRIHDMIAVQKKVSILPEQLIVFDPEVTPEWEAVVPWGLSEGIVLVVLDEAQLFYGSRDWASTAANNKRLLSFLTQSRKAGVDLIWITQDGGNVDKQFRVLAEWELAICNVKHLPLGWLGLFPLNAYCCKHISARLGVVCRRTWFTYSSYIKGCYKTDALLNEQMRNLGANAKKLGLLKLEKLGMRKRLGLYLREEWRKLLKKPI